MKVQNEPESPATTAVEPIQFYGSPDVFSPSGVDVSLLRERLKLTVTGRWERNFEALKLVEAFREVGRARRAEDSPTAD